MSKQLDKAKAKIEKAKSMNALQAGKKAKLAEQVIDDVMVWAYDLELRVSNIEAQLNGDDYGD